MYGKYVRAGVFAFVHAWYFGTTVAIWCVWRRRGKIPSHGTPTSSRSPWMYSKSRMAKGGPPGTLFPLTCYHVDHTYTCLPQSLLYTYLCFLGHNRVQPKMNFRCNLRPNSSARTCVQVHRRSYYVNIDWILFTAVALLQYMGVARRIRQLLRYVPACPR